MKTFKAIMNESPLRWSKPYHGVSHCGNLGDARWGSVVCYPGGSVDAQLHSKDHKTGEYRTVTHMVDHHQKAMEKVENWIRGVE